MPLTSTSKLRPMAVDQKNDSFTPFLLVFAPLALHVSDWRAGFKLGEGFDSGRQIFSCNKTWCCPWENEAFALMEKLANAQGICHKIEKSSVLGTNAGVNATEGAALSVTKASPLTHRVHEDAVKQGKNAPELLGSINHADMLGSRGNCVFFFQTFTVHVFSFQQVSSFLLSSPLSALRFRFPISLEFKCFDIVSP